MELLDFDRLPREPASPSAAVYSGQKDPPLDTPASFPTDSCLPTQAGPRCRLAGAGSWLITTRGFPRTVQAMAALTEQPPLTICEFYSGIGVGPTPWRRPRPEDHDILQAVDASTTCSAIYAHNFGRATQRRVENLTTNDVAGADG